MFSLPDSQTAIRLFFYQFFIVAANVTARTSRDTFLMQGEYARHLPLLIAFTAVVMYLVVRAQALFSGGSSPVAVAVVAPLIAMLSYAPFGLFPMSGLASAVYFIWTEVVNSLLSVQFWILAAAVLDMRAGKKLFGLIGAGGAIGGLIAGLVLAPLGKKFGVATLPLGAGIMLLASIPFVIGLKSRPAEDHGSMRDSSANSQWNLFHPYIKILCLLLIPATIVSTLVDYQFKIVSAAAIPDSAALAAYFGRYYAILNGLTLVFQIFVTSFFLTRLGLLFSLMFLPVFLTLVTIPFAPLSLAAGTQILSLLVALSFAGRLTDQTVKFTIYQGAFQLLWLPVPPLHKSTLKMSVEAVIKNGIAGLAGLGIAAAAWYFPPKGATFYQLQAVIALITLAFLMLWIYAAYAARQGYRKYLSQSIESRLVDFSTDTIEVNSPEIHDTVRSALLSGDEAKIAFALDILANQQLNGWEPDLQSVFGTSSPLVQARILEMAEHHAVLLDKDFVLQCARGAGEHRLAAQIIAARREYTELRDILSAQSEDQSDQVMVNVCCRAIMTEENKNLREQFNNYLRNDDKNVRGAALKAAVHFPELAEIYALQVNLEDKESSIRRLALDVTRAGKKQILVREVILNLADAKTYSAAKATLAVMHPAFVQNELESAEYFNPANPELLHGILRYLGSSRLPEALKLIIRYTPVSNPRIFSAACKSAAAIIPALKKKSKIRRDIDSKIEEACGLYYTALKIVISKNAFTGERALVIEWLEGAMARWIIAACRLATAGGELSNIEARFNGRNLKVAKRSEFLELIENAVSPRVKTLLLAILDGKSDEEVAKRLESLFRKRPTPGSAWLHSGADWPATMAVLMILGSGGDVNKKWSLLVARPLPALAREVLIRHAAAEPDKWRKELSSENLLSFDKLLHEEVNLTMYPTLEKILLLKSVGMFSDISGEDISRLIQISREVELPAGRQIFHSGEEGHELFILLAGEIKIHHEERELARLKRGDFLGEMALLDNEPRSADATTLTDCKLLSIGQQDFFDVLSGRPEILRGILKLLSGRLRKAIQLGSAAAS